MKYIENLQFDNTTEMATNHFTLCYLEENMRKQKFINLLLSSVIKEEVLDPFPREQLIKDIPRMLKDAIKLNIEQLFQLIHICHKNLLGNMPSIPNDTKRCLLHHSICDHNELFV